MLGSNTYDHLNFRKPLKAHLRFRSALIPVSLCVQFNLDVAVVPAQLIGKSLGYSEDGGGGGDDDDMKTTLTFLVGYAINDIWT